MQYSKLSRLVETSGEFAVINCVEKYFILDYEKNQIQNIKAAF